MTKNITLLILSFLFFHVAQAQRDSVTLYMKNSGQVVAGKEQADYILMVMTPADSSSGTKVNSIKEYHTNNSLLFTGKAIIHIDGNNHLNLKFVGTCVNFYPNGVIYTIKKYDNEGKLYLIECYDKKGNNLAKNGNGSWLKYDTAFKQIMEKGQIIDSLEEGDWQVMIINDTAKYINHYIKGVIVSRSFNQQIFSAVEQEPSFPNGPAALNAFLARVVKYPAIDRENRTVGKVILTFVVEKDGTLSDIKVLRSPTTTMGDACIDAIKSSPPWYPGVQNGKPVRVQYTISFSFSLASG